MVECQKGHTTAIIRAQSQSPKRRKFSGNLINIG